MYVAEYLAAYTSGGIYLAWYLVEYMYLAEYLGLYLWRNADGVPGNGGPPDHEVGVGRYPQDAPNKGDRKEFPR